MKTKKGSPSGVGSRIYAATKFKPISLTELGFSQSVLRLLMVLLVLPMAFVNAWGMASSYVKTETAAPAEGLVYCSKSNSANPSQSDYKRYYPGGSGTGSSNAGCYVNLGAAKSGVYIYCWAKPARGYEFDHWDGYEKGYLPYGDQNKSKMLYPDTWNGVNDQMVGTCGNGESTYKQHQAYFRPATSYTITYMPPVGGSYSVSYSYLKTRQTTGEEYEFYTDNSESYNMTPTSENTSVKSYAADVITLSVPSETTNFIGWYENDVKIEDSETKKTLTYTAHADVTIEPKFKELAWGDVTGDLTITETAQDAQKREEDNPHNGIIYVAIPTLIGTWTAADFTVTPVNTSNSFGSIAIGTVSLDLVSNRLVIPYTYTATNWGGVEADLTITPSFGATKQFTIACSAEEVVSYEACIEESGERTYTGTLAAMMAQANTMTNKPVVKLMQNKAITAPLSFTQSFTFDVNGKVLTANCASAFSIDAAGVDVKIIDGSFTQVGEIHTSYSSSGNVNVVTFTQAAKLTMQGGTLSAENTGAGSAYGVDVQQGSIFYMTGGDLTVTATSGNAQGAHVATSSDYATFNGGSITVSAPTNAYGMWSSGQSNITNATISVEATTGANAYGVYVNGGTSTVTTTDFTVNAATTNAYGANVNAGRLNVNGGSFAATAVEDKVYGVYVASGATAMLQQKATVTASVTAGNGTANVEVCGIHNMGTASLSNISVTATNNSTTATASTNYVAAVSTFTGAVSTTIEDGTYTANAETGYAYAIRHRNGTLNVDGGTYKGILKTSGVGAFGAHLSANATIANATLLGETRGSGSKAHGVVGSAGTITLTNCELTGLSNTNIAYAIYSRTDVSATGCVLIATTLGSANANGGADAYGLYAESGTNSLTNCNATVTSNTIKAYGAYHKAGSLTINGGIYNVEAKQATATAAQTTVLYGLYNESGMTTAVTDATFNVTAINASYAQYVYGAYINGTLNSTSTTYNVTACRYVYGMQGMGSSNLVLANNTIRVEATNANTANNNSSWSYGIYAKKNFTINGDKVDAIGQIKDVYAMYFESNSLGNVLDGKFSAQGNGTNGYGALNASATVGKVYLKGGVYKSAINLAKYAYTDYKVYNMDASHPDYADGYRYTIATENPSPYVCRIVGGAYYATLKEALQYTLDNSGNYTIVMTQPHTLPAGEYTLPANATLVIPYKFDQNAITVQGSNPANPDTRITAGLVENFLCLTIADGVHLNVNGKIGVGGELFCQQTNKSSYINGPYGRIHMEEGSLIQLNSGSFLYAWGMITGDGNIIVKNNAEVHEMFQVGDMKSASNLATYYNNNSEKFFPITQYGILNIEVPTTYYYNSRLIGALLCYYPGLGGVYYGEKNVKLVGTENALFEITTEDETTWVRKSYKNARQVWDINSSAKLGSISINISVSGMSSSFNSANYILPITYNMDMHVLSGDFEITHNAELLPGSTIEIDKTASLTIKEGQKLYVFDKDQWPLSSSYDDAAINVHGNINVEGSLYTSNKGSETSKTDGANVYSNNADAGTIFFENAAPSSASSIDLITSIDANGKVKKTVTMDPALLKNGTGASQAFTPTSGTDDGHAFAYINNEWTQTYTEGCFEIKGEHTYAKPGDYVELKKQREQETVGYDDMFIRDNHTYLSIDETRIFIHLLDAEGDCQWWEVTQVGTSDVYYCATNGIYYQYQYDEEFHEWYWREKVVTVTFYSDEEGTTPLKVITTNYMGIPDQAVIASNPTKATTTGYTYQFYGWQSSVEPYKTYPWTATLEEAEDDMYYLPVFTATPRNYTVTFINANNGANVPVETAYNTHPVCTPAPTKAATAQYTYFFQNWEGYEPGATLPAVTGATSYTAVWAQTVNKYSITWKNGDEVLETDTKQPYGTATAFNGTLPTKETDDNFVYAFSGWRSSLTGQTYANGSTPTVAGETTYEAQFNTTPRYAITFNNYDGTELQKESVTAGEHPIYNGLTPGRTRDLDGYFRFIGWKNSDGTDFAPNATLPAVTGKETYTAQYDYVTELYWITFHNVTGKNDLTDDDDNWRGKFGVESTPYYDPNNDDVADEPAKADGMEDGLMYVYTFSGWSPELQPVSGEAEYTAQFSKEVKKYTITFTNLDGNGAQEEFEVAYGTTPEDLATLVTPENADNYYTYPFDSWTPALAMVTADAVYTASFQEGVARTFPITFDPDNGVDAPYVMNVAYDDTPTPAVPATWQDAANIYTFSGWTPAIHAVDGPAEYTAQYTPTIRSYTITFKNYDGTTLDTYTLTYGATPSYSGTPERPVDLENLKKYTFTGWSPAITSVSADAVYTATYSEQSFIATVTPNGGSPAYKSSWNEIFANGSITANCTVKLYADITNPTNNQSISQNMTLDLNGHTISFSASQNGNARLFYVNGVALTIEDSHGGGVISYQNTRTDNNSQAYTIYVNGTASVTINGGTIKAERTSGNYASAAVYLNSGNSTLYLNDGELIATENSGGSGYAVAHRNTNSGYSYIRGGKLKGKSNIFQNPAAGRITLSGGYYSVDPGNSVTIATGYEKLTISEDGYIRKVAPKTNINYTVKHFQQNLENDQYTEFESETKQGTTAMATAAEAKNYEGFTALPFEQGTIAGNGSTVVNIYYDRNTYTIIWKNGDATLETDENVKYGTMPSYDGATPTKANSETQTFVFSGWSPEVAEVNGDVTYYAQFKAFDLNLVVDEADEIDASISVTTTTVTVSGTLEIDPGVTLTTTNLILEASEIGSGQILDGGTINATNVYYDLTLNTAARHWHAFGVPWAVDLNVNPLTEVETGRTLTLGSNYEIVYYDTHTRATEGPGANCWKYLKHYDQPGQSIDVLNPGQGYMIAFTTPVQTVRFVKKYDAPIIFNGSVTVTAEGEGTDKGINAIANPMAYHANLNVAGVGQVHDGGEIGSDGYDPVTISNMNYIVGKTVYVQVDDAQTITPTNGISHAVAPVRRAAKATDKKYMVLEDYYTVELTNANGVGSKLYVLPEEDKEDKYVIGHDLAKMGMSTKKAQIWVNRYGVNLGLNTTAPIHETAEFPINLYAPVADDYTIGLAAQPDDEYIVYLTLDGVAIWNLSDAPYTISLNNGTTKGYGLRLSRKASQTLTGVDEAVVDAKGEIIKVLIEDKVFIIREGNVYSVDGQLVK